MSEPVCGRCNGEGTVKAIACPGGHVIDMRCTSCNGEGVISELRTRELAEAETRRLDRIQRGLSLREEAKRLGITPQELSRLEHAR